MSNLPRAVREAEELADRLQKELIEQSQAPEAPEQPAPPQEAAPEQTPEQTPNGSEQPAPVVNAQPQPQPEDLEHRYKVLQGKYNAEVPRLSSENKELRTRLQTLEQQLEEMKAAVPKASLVKPEEIEEYGEGLIDVARRIAREELAAKEQEIEKLKAEINSIKSVTTKTVENDFFKTLGEMVPDWQQMNTDEGFLKWLDQVDELTGEQRIQLLSKAEAQRDAVRAAKFFQAFKKESSTWAAKSQDALAAQVVPPASPAPNTPQAKRIWTRGEIQQFYDRMRRGTVTDQEAIAIEADINAALVEGRIR